MASKHRFREEVKVITMESGKTTFIRQIKSIYGEGSFSEEERVGYRGVIFSNVMKGAKILCEARRRLQIPFENPANESTYHIGSTLLPEEFQQYVMPLKALWVDSGIQATFKRRNEFQLVCVCMCMDCISNFRFFVSVHTTYCPPPPPSPQHHGPVQPHTIQTHQRTMYVCTLHMLHASRPDVAGTVG